MIMMMMMMMMMMSITIILFNDNWPICWNYYMSSGKSFSLRRTKSGAWRQNPRINCFRRIICCLSYKNCPARYLWSFLVLQSTVLVLTWLVVDIYISKTLIFIRPCHYRWETVVEQQSHNFNTKCSSTCYLDGKI